MINTTPQRQIEQTLSCETISQTSIKIVEINSSPFQNFLAELFEYETLVNKQNAIITFLEGEITNLKDQQRLKAKLIENLENLVVEKGKLIKDLQDHIAQLSLVKDSQFQGLLIKTGRGLLKKYSSMFEEINSKLSMNYYKSSWETTELKINTFNFSLKNRVKLPSFSIVEKEEEENFDFQNTSRVLFIDDNNKTLKKDTPKAIDKFSDFTRDLMKSLSKVQKQDSGMKLRNQRLLDPNHIKKKLIRRQNGRVVVRTGGGYFTVNDYVKELSSDNINTERFEVTGIRGDEKLNGTKRVGKMKDSLKKEIKKKSDKSCNVSHDNINKTPNESPERRKTKHIKNNSVIYLK